MVISKISLEKISVYSYEWMLCWPVKNFFGVGVMEQGYYAKETSIKRTNVYAILCVVIERDP